MLFGLYECMLMRECVCGSCPCFMLASVLRFCYNRIVLAGSFLYF